MLEHLDPTCNCPGRICRGCDSTKCHKAFSKDAKGSLGLSARCKDCVRAYQKSHIDEINASRRENRRENADHYNAYNREFHRKNPESKKARNRKYREEKTEKINVGWNSWRNRNAERVNAYKREYDRKYRQEHPGASAANFANRQSRKRQAGGEFSTKEWRTLCAYYDYTCLCCWKLEPEIKLTSDHLVPLARGCTNFIDNIQPLCLSCNMSKGAKTIDYRVRWQK